MPFNVNPFPSYGPGGNNPESPGQRTVMYNTSPWETDLATRRKLEGDLATTKLSVNAKKYGDDLAFKQAENQRIDKNNRFTSVMQSLQGLLGNFNAGSTSVGGSSGTGPEITVGPVYSEQDIQRQINQSRAFNDAKAQTGFRTAQSQATGRGFSSRSPMLAALEGQYRNQALASSAEQETAFRTQAASENAGQILKGQQLRENQYASRMNEDIERRKPIFNTYNAMLSALAGLA